MSLIHIKFKYNFRWYLLKSALLYTDLRPRDADFWLRAASFFRLRS